MAGYRGDRRSTVGRARRGLTTVTMMVAMTALLVVGLSPPASATSPNPAATTTSVQALARPSVPGADDATIDAVTRLYLAVFGRLPDPEGHDYWVTQRLAGADLADLAAAFMVSEEWAVRYGPVDSTTFVDLLYGNVLGRGADSGGGHYWRSVLDQGVTRTQVLLQFSESDEFVARTGTTPPLPPYPPVPTNSGSGRRIVYANQAQRVWLIEADGSVHDSYLVSGRRDTPNPGTYTVFSKSPRAWAGHGGITMNHMVRFAHGRSLAIGFHSIPTRAGGRPLQTLAQLGTHRSAGCVRQSEDKAEALYHWAGIGTTVVVLP